MNRAGADRVLSRVGFLKNARKERITPLDGREIAEKAAKLPLLPFMHALLTIFWCLSKKPTPESGQGRDAQNGDAQGRGKPCPYIL
jgi:hypothetical protein